MINKKTLFILNLLLFIGCSSIVKKVIPLSPLPTPTGKYTIGTTQYHWLDVSRQEWFSKEDTTDFRELMVQIWYPSDQKPIEEPVAYMDFLEQRIPEVAKQVGLPKFMINQISEISTNSYYEIPISNKEQQFPVLIFSHGLGGMRVQNTAYIQELVSHGYIIAAMDHTYDANITIFPDGRKRLYDSNLPEGLTDSTEAYNIRYKQLNARTSDVVFVLDELEKLNSDENHPHFFNKLKLNNVGIFGHSFGGATSISTAYNDPRITACFTLDAWFEIIPHHILNSGLKTPFFHLGQEKWKKPLNYKNRDNLIKNSSGPNWVSTFLGSKHFDYIDLPLFTHYTKRFKLTGEIDPIAFYKTLNELHLTFFNFYIKKIDTFLPKSIDEKISFLTIENSNNTTE